MITVRRSADRGHANHGWLDAHHTFSFADYHDPAWDGYSALRVLNQDRVAPSAGFGLHGHRNMEIVTWVLQGSLEHKDDLGNKGEIVPGDVQLMSAGSGIRHSEFNPSATEETHLLQMWVEPLRRGTRPTYAERKLSPEQFTDRLALLASPDGQHDSLVIGQDVRLYGARLSPGAIVVQPLGGRKHWLHLAQGELVVGDTVLHSGDGLAMEDEPVLELQALQHSELVLFDLP